MKTEPKRELSWQSAIETGDLDQALAGFQVEGLTDADRIALRRLTQALDNVWYEGGYGGIRSVVTRHRPRLIQIVRQIGALPDSSLTLQWDLLQLQVQTIDLLISRGNDKASPESVESTLETIQLCGELLRIRHRAIAGDAWTEQLDVSLLGQFFDVWMNRTLRKKLEFLGSSSPDGTVVQEAIADVLRTRRDLPDMPDKAIEDIEYSLDFRSEGYATEAEFQDGLRYYQALTSGSVRPIAIEDLKAISFAKAELRELVQYFEESGRRHGVPPALLAAFALHNLMFKAKRPTYSLGGGFDLIEKYEDPEKYWEKPTKYKIPGWLKWFVRPLAKVVGGIRVQDRAVDYLAGVWAGFSPTFGLMQIRAQRVLEEGLWSPWPSDVFRTGETDDVYRSINKKLLDPKWNIEAAAARWGQHFRKVLAAQQAGTKTTVPNLQTLTRFGLATEYDPLVGFYGPDPLARASFEEWRTIPGVTERGWDLAGLSIDGMLAFREWLMPRFHILVHETGLFDTPGQHIPGIVVGITNVDQVNQLKEWIESDDTEQRDAALRSLIVLQADSSSEVGRLAQVLLRNFRQQHTELDQTFHEQLTRQAEMYQENLGDRGASRPHIEPVAPEKRAPASESEQQQKQAGKPQTRREFMAKLLPFGNADRKGSPFARLRTLYEQRAQGPLTTTRLMELSAHEDKMGGYTRPMILEETRILDALGLAHRRMVGGAYVTELVDDVKQLSEEQFIRFRERLWNEVLILREGTHVPALDHWTLTNKEIAMIKPQVLQILAEVSAESAVVEAEAILARMDSSPTNVSISANQSSTGQESEGDEPGTWWADATWEPEVESESWQSEQNDPFASAERKTESKSSVRSDSQTTQMGEAKKFGEVRVVMAASDVLAMNGGQGMTINQLRGVLQDPRAMGSDSIPFMFVLVDASTTAEQRERLQKLGYGSNVVAADSFSQEFRHLSDLSLMVIATDGALQRELRDFNTESLREYIFRVPAGIDLTNFSPEMFKVVFPSEKLDPVKLKEAGRFA